MKKYLVLLLFGYVCCGQTIIPIFRTTYQDFKGGYLKDTFNDFDTFTGTWEYVSGTTKLTVTLKKRLNFYNDFSDFHEDLIFGEYRYIENGVEKINTLPLLLNPDPDPFGHNIVGNIINTPDRVPVCSTCPAGQKRLLLYFKDPQRDSRRGVRGIVILRRVDSGGQQKLEMWLKADGPISYPEDNSLQHTTLNVPYGTYILTKQP